MWAWGPLCPVARHRPHPGLDDGEGEGENRLAAPRRSLLVLSAVVRDVKDHSETVWTKELWGALSPLPHFSHGENRSA